MNRLKTIDQPDPLFILKVLFEEFLCSFNKEQTFTFFLVPLITKKMFNTENLYNKKSCS